MAEKQCPRKPLTFSAMCLWIFGGSAIVTISIVVAGHLLRPHPMLGLLIVVALCAGIVYCILKRPEWIKRFSSGERAIEWANKEENEPKVVFGLLACLAIFTFAGSGIFQLEAIKERDAMVETAIKEGAPTVSIDGWCIKGQVYNRTDNGKIVSRDIKCDENGNIVK